MINGLGVVGWGVGGIEAEAGMLGQPVTFLAPEVVGVYLTGALKEGVTATDLVLARHRRCSARPRSWASSSNSSAPAPRRLAVVDRATIANMAPGIRRHHGLLRRGRRDASTYLRGTGRSEELCSTFKNYYKAQGLWGIPDKGQVDYSVELELDLSTVVPGVAGPKRPQDRIELPKLKQTFETLFDKPVAEGGYGKTPPTSNQVRRPPQRPRRRRR